MASSVASPELLIALHNKATHLRIESVRATSEAGSGHPSSCCSAADIVATLFFSVMRYDPRNPKADNSDRFVLSKGHAAPALYAAWAEAGAFPVERLITLRQFTSDLEGHPTPRLPWVDDFSAGYFARSFDKLPKNGDRHPWRVLQDYKAEKKILTEDPIEDGVMQFTKAGEIAKPLASASEPMLEAAE